jgi:hypothetical protein
MTLVGLEWANNGASDVHLVPQVASPEFFRLLMGQVRVANGTIELHHVFSLDNTTVMFTQQVTGTNGGHGITVDAKTGEVTLSPPTDMNGRSFLLKVDVKQGTDPTVTTFLRIYVHNVLQRMWITPKRLTVRKSAKSVRFSVLALFDDGVIGDISNWSPFERTDTPGDRTYVHLPKVDTPVLSWSAGGGPITVDQQTGILAAPTDIGETPITVQFSAGTASGNAVGTAVCAPAWTNGVNLDLAGGPGVAQADKVPNILFLPDGFQQADRSDYEREVRLIVKRLETRNRTRPYAALTGRMNYWRGWLASTDAGVTALGEVDPDPKKRKGDIDRGDDVPQPSLKLPPPAANWKLPDLVTVVGLPHPTADHPGDPKANKLADLQRLYERVNPAAVSQAVFDTWLNLSDRALLNERNTAFHMAFFTRPSAAAGSEEQELLLNPRRLTDEDFNTFLDALRGPHGEVIGPGRLWTTGKDKDLVVMVCRSSHVGGVTSPRNVAAGVKGHTLGLSLADRPFHQVRRNVDGDGFELIPDTVPTDVFYSVWMATAHELGHAFGLGDEYGGNQNPPEAADIADAAKAPNLQDSASAHTAGHLDVGKLKWADWPRIAKAGVLSGQPVAAGGRLTVPLVDVARSRLAVRDIVKFRKRPLVTAGKPSDICMVVDVDPGSNHVIVTPLFGGTVTPGDFPAGSILLAFVREPDPDFDNQKFGGLLNLVDSDVLIRIGATGNPLNAKPEDPVDRPDPNKELIPPVKATNFPGGIAPKPPPFSSWIIGAFENGHEHNSGFYHPTGTCVMNASSRAFIGGGVFLYDFCLICRYGFIDNVDPTLHGEVEQDFRDRYGRKGAQ